MRKKNILRQIIGVWAENDLKIGIFETDQPIVYKQQAKLPKFPQKQDNNKWPSKGQASLTLAKVSVYDSTICSKKKTTASYLTLWLSTLLSVWRTWGVPTPTKHRIPQKKTCMEVEVIRRGGALLLLFNMPRWGKHVGRQARQ